MNKDVLLEIVQKDFSNINALIRTCKTFQRWMFEKETLILTAMKRYEANIDAKIECKYLTIYNDTYRSFSGFYTVNNNIMYNCETKKIIFHKQQTKDYLLYIHSSSFLYNIYLNCEFFVSSCIEAATISVKDNGFKNGFKNLIQHFYRDVVKFYNLRIEKRPNVINADILLQFMYSHNQKLKHLHLKNIDLLRKHVTHCQRWSSHFPKVVITMTFIGCCFAYYCFTN